MLQRFDMAWAATAIDPRSALQPLGDKLRCHPPAAHTNVGGAGVEIHAVFLAHLSQPCRKGMKISASENGKTEIVPVGLFLAFRELSALGDACVQFPSTTVGLQSGRRQP